MVHTIVAEFPSEGTPRVLGIGIAPAAGIRRGVAIDLLEATNSIRASLEEALAEAKISPRAAYVAIGGPHLSISASRGVVAVSRADGEISEEDIQRVVHAAETFIPKNPNREIVHIVPREFRVDNEGGIKDPVGMNGVRLEVDALIVDVSVSSVKNLTKCVMGAGSSVRECVFSPLAAAEAVLTKRQKELGALLVDIGGGTTNFAVFEEGRLAHAGGFPYGASHITNDIAIGLRTSIDVAEKVKLEFGNAKPSEISKNEDINLSDLDSNEEGIVSRYHVAEIIEARLEEIFNMVNKELKTIGRDKLLPGGIVLVGGTAKLPGAVDLAKNILGLPAQTGFPSPLGGLIDKVDEPSFVTAVGLVLWGMESMPSGKLSGFFSSNKMVGNFSNSMGGTVNSMKKWLGKFLP